MAVAALVVGYFAIDHLLGGSSAQTALDTANESIAKLGEAYIPTQEDFNKALSDYNAVPNEYKNEVQGAEILDRFKDVDLKKVRDIETRINGITQDTYFSDILDLEEEYKKLTVQEQQFVNGDKLNEMKQPNETEEAAIAALKYLRSLLGNADNFRPVSVTVKDDREMSMSYRMQITYSYVDEQGTLNENTTYISMMSADDDTEYRNAVEASDPDSFLKGTADMKAYHDCESDEMVLDTDKLIYYSEDQ